MSETLPTQYSPLPVKEEKKEKKLKKSTLVDQGLLAKSSTAEIVASVLTSFPEATEKSIRNLISVRRSRLKKLQG